jgi:hypothetical protein
MNPKLNDIQKMNPPQTKVKKKMLSFSKKNAAAQGGSRREEAKLDQ